MQRTALYIAILLCLLSATRLQAQPFSYVYIQGDKETPFYVKLENEMMPRYGKNFSIISELAPGPIHIQILFQQNAYPPVNFTLNVPDNGFRGLMLTRKGNDFSLYDIYYKFYIQAGNVASDDKAPNRNIRTAIPASLLNARETPVQEKPVTTQPRITPPEPKPVKETVITTSKPATKPKPTPTPKPALVPVPEPKTPADNGQPQFINDVTLDNGRSIQNNGIINSDCPLPLNSIDFSNLQKRVLERDDKERLSLLMNRMNYCYSTKQVRILAESLGADADRLTFLKRVYARTSNQSEFPSLESLLSSDETKEEFKALIIQH